MKKPVTPASHDPVTGRGDGGKSMQIYFSIRVTL